MLMLKTFYLFILRNLHHELFSCKWRFGSSRTSAKRVFVIFYLFLSYASYQPKTGCGVTEGVGVERAKRGAMGQEQACFVMP